MAVKLKADGRSRYAVVVDGREIGQVWKFEQRYNLRRMLVVRYWRASLLNGAAGAARNPNTHGGGYDTRAEAVAALVAADAERDDG